MDKNSCAFTGHRPEYFPWKYDETARDCVRLKEVMAAQIKVLAGRGVTEFLSGMALGVDLWAAQMVLELKRANPALNLHCILPCEGQERKWPVSAQEAYHAILKQAASRVYIQRQYSPTCMQERNRYLVDNAGILLAVYNGVYRSGTGMTLRYAQKCGREILMIEPISREVTHIPVKR